MLHTQGKFNKKWYCKHTYVVQQQLFMKGGGEGMVIVSQRDVCNTGTPSGVSRESSVSFFFKPSRLHIKLGFREKYEQTFYYRVFCSQLKLKNNILL